MLYYLRWRERITLLVVYHINLDARYLWVSKPCDTLLILIEHFGEANAEAVQDPLNKKWLDSIEKQANINSEFYYYVFKAEPDDNQINFDILKRDREVFKNRPEDYLRKLYNEQKDKVKGFYVKYPTQYLRDENLELQASNVATKLVPAINFV